MNLDWLVGRRCTAVGKPTDHATTFAFGDATFYVETLWRISERGRLRRISRDDGQRYGLGRTIDARGEAEALLRAHTVRTVVVDLLRGDVRLEFEDGWVLEFLTDAMYEPWQLTWPGGGIVASAGGTVVKLPAPPRS